MLALVGLSGFGDRAVGTLSGGERQRVALARALAPSPALLMLDEPLGALDRTLRDRLVLELSELFAELSIGVIYVTHDQAEALALADRVVVMDRGRVVQEGPPEQVWAAPADPFVARFLGLSNVFAASGVGPRRPGLDGPRPRWRMGTEGSSTQVLIRPEAVGWSRPGPDALEATVEAVAFRGDHTQVWLSLPSGHAWRPDARAPIARRWGRVGVAIDPPASDASADPVVD